MTNRLRGIKEDARSRRFEDVVRCGKLSPAVTIFDQARASRRLP
jgi:hypothetical protein